MPEALVILVGHSDAASAVGASETARRPRDCTGPDSSQGRGFLVPRASDATPDGRAQNRRVEVVLMIP